MKGAFLQIRREESGIIVRVTHRTNEAAARDDIFRTGYVTSGTAAHSASVAVPCPLYCMYERAECKFDHTEQTRTLHSGYDASYSILGHTGPASGNCH